MLGRSHLWNVVTNPFFFILCDVVFVGAQLMLTGMVNCCFATNVKFIPTALLIIGRLTEISCQKLPSCNLCSLASCYRLASPPKSWFQSAGSRKNHCCIVILLLCIHCLPFQRFCGGCRKYANVDGLFTLSSPQQAIGLLRLAAYLKKAG